MPTAIATPTSTDPVISDALWRSYRRARAANPERVASYAAGLALDEQGIPADRGRLERLLYNREVEKGLRPSRHEREQDALADAEAAQAARAAIVDGSIDAIEIDARERIEELKLQIERMSVEALTDANVATEQKAALSELTEVELALANVTRARPETARREAEAAEQAERKARAKAEDEARALQRQIAKAAARVNTAAGVFAESVAAFRDLKEAQVVALAAAGRDQAVLRGRYYRAGEVSAALWVALRDRGVKIDGVEGGRHAAPLAETAEEEI